MYNLDFNILTFCLIFYIYCFLGWCFESTYVSLKNGKRWVNRGFMKGPFLPIYGSGAVIILFVTVPVMFSPLLVYVMSVFAATALELITGMVMEKLFKIKYWDYSNNFLNYKGYICLESSIAWGFMGLLVTYIINEPIANFINSVNTVYLAGITVIITALFVYDFVVSFREAYDLRSMILDNEKLMKEINEIKVNIAVAVGDANYKKDELVAEIKEKIDTALSYTEIDDYILEKIEELKKLEIADYIELWKEKSNALKERIENVDLKKIAILKRNPTAKSRFGFVREIREFVKKK